MASRRYQELAYHEHSRSYSYLPDNFPNDSLPQPGGRYQTLS